MARNAPADAPVRPPIAPDPHRRAWLHLGHAPGVTCALRVALRRHAPDTARLGAALEALIDGDDALVAPLGPLSADAARLLRSAAARRAVDVALDWEVRAPDRHLITLGAVAPGDPASPTAAVPYPESVACLEDAPPALALRGDPGSLHAPGLAIVGSRRATRRGLAHARLYADAFARQGMSIVSGLAQGVDAAAHEAAMDAGGLTLAVVATGPDRVYPARHARLAERIAERGAVIAEHPCGFELRPYHFPHRNRLITALSLGTLVAEAADPSGTLGTAAHANAQSRAVMAVPGLPGDPASAGCHRLVREGAATLVASPDDVAHVLRHHLRLLLDDDAREAEIRARLAHRASAREIAASAVHAARIARLDGGAGAPGSTGGDANGGVGAGARLVDASPEALRVHAALDGIGRDAGALAVRTGLGVGSVAAALAQLEVRGAAARDGTGGYVRCKPPR